MGARFEVVAHRGFRARYPENTLAAVAAALDAGAHHVEVDVHLSADGVPVLCHDADLARVSGRPGRVAELPAAVLADWPAGEPGRLGDRFPRARLATLAEAARLVAARGRHLFVELKPDPWQRFGAAALDALADALAPVPGLRWTLISFLPEVVEAARAAELAPAGWVLPAYDAGARAAARELAPPVLFVDRAWLPPRGALWPGPWRWAVYEVNTPREAARLAARGAGLIETAEVALLRAAVCG
ncbi:glycerophosphodiester phosphodiesterase family protein [Inmirania thermothiophila]|uniref:Glycerophosphoryl diester phosphodiesterase n=1 Tax=Inmirania thermothiophila TaxID=1750597 RepID=A0A3N1XS76_9GAMM|nr:glycerophosphodiester phosphodiesterase family protein [Inmirania thermothiophila]ROR29513.1 glycerophosphoryl diester phosphodiesterase [Inmirania thermothiophila]